jgi:hypothetical protein
VIYRLKSIIIYCVNPNPGNHLSFIIWVDIHMSKFEKKYFNPIFFIDLFSNVYLLFLLIFFNFLWFVFSAMLRLVFFWYGFTFLAVVDYFCCFFCFGWCSYVKSRRYFLFNLFLVYIFLFSWWKTWREQRKRWRTKKERWRN